MKKKVSNVKDALNKLGVKFPVALDNDYKIWNLYSNAWWPRRILVNASGKVVLDHIGDGEYAQTETKIRELLMRELHWPQDMLPESDSPDNTTGGICYQTTPELYLGYGRGQIGAADFVPDKVAVYHDISHPDMHMWYASGTWIARREYFEHAQDEEAAWIHLKFMAFSVNCVMESADGAETTILVTLHGRPLLDNEKGRDVDILPDGKSVVRVSRPRMYNILSSSDFVEGGLKLFVRKRGLRMFAFTFGGCDPKTLAEAVWKE